MSAQRRTVTKRDVPAPPAGAAKRSSGDGTRSAPLVATAGSGSAQPPSSRPPKPVEATRTTSEPSALALRLDSWKRSYRDTIAELKKVNWPDRETTKNLTIVVIGISVVLGLLLGGIDFLLQTLFEWLA
jgi:preprotein translocase subunit SecE